MKKGRKSYEDMGINLGIRSTARKYRAIKNVNKINFKKRIGKTYSQLYTKCVQLKIRLKKERKIMPPIL